jgi:small subunit ribosomal protein S6
LTIHETSGKETDLSETVQLFYNLLALCLDLDSEGHFKSTRRNNMRRYETIFIAKPNATEDDIEAIAAKTTSIIEGDGGIIFRINKWGLRKLAYLIKKESQGYYVYIDYTGIPASVAEIERVYRIDDRILKYMTVKTADSCDPEAVKEQLAKAEPVRVPGEDVAEKEDSGPSDEEENE